MSVESVASGTIGALSRAVFRFMATLHEFVEWVCNRQDAKDAKPAEKWEPSTDSVLHEMNNVAMVIDHQARQLPVMSNGDLAIDYRRGQLAIVRNRCNLVFWLMEGGFMSPETALQRIKDTRKEFGV